jgi:hypothetical protein
VARARDRQDTKSLTVTLPEPAFAYLQRLAATTMLGANESSIAALLLINELVRMRVQGVERHLARSENA